MPRFLFSIVLLSGLFGLVAFSGCGAASKEVVISRSQIQAMVDKKFPFDANAVIARLTVDSPRVYFVGTNVGIEVHIQGGFMGTELEGTVDLNGRLTYEKEEGAFFLKDIEISEITVNDAGFRDTDRFKPIVAKMVTNYLDDFPVYRLDTDDSKQSIAKYLLKDIAVRGDTLVVTLGL